MWIDDTFNRLSLRRLPRREWLSNRAMEKHHEPIYQVRHQRNGIAVLRFCYSGCRCRADGQGPRRDLETYLFNGPSDRYEGNKGWARPQTAWAYDRNRNWFHYQLSRRRRTQ